MWTNGCTYGKDHHCGHHGTPEQTQPHTRKGSIIRVTRYSGGMRRYGSWKRVKPLEGMEACPKVEGPRCMLKVRKPGHKLARPVAFTS